MDEPSEVDGLVARLRDRVEERRRSGAYPADLEEEMTAHFRRILHQRRGARDLPDIEGPVLAARSKLPLEAKQIPATSALPGGELLHKAVARIVSRQTQGALQQVEAFARPVQEALEALLAAIQELDRRIQVDVAHSLDALYERQAATERRLAAAGLADHREGPGEPEA